ncbi:uncharacterized protein LOC133902535 [Phragmites australis]|uniref:uncharacterized protein LOC133902535 n=1 Tax=Phragmites australis TaxID=29695 RepID=UPI002D775C5D|nr:uncharacterized protein LOC133902535 [Phragmites australis]
MMVEGLIPFVCGAIKKRRRERRTMDYERLSSSGAPPTQGRPERFAGAAYGHSQSCRFVARSPADELDLSHGERLRAGRRAPPEGLPAEQFPPAGDGRGVSRSRRFSSTRLFACVGGA